MRGSKFASPLKTSSPMLSGCSSGLVQQCGPFMRAYWCASIDTPVRVHAQMRRADDGNGCFDGNTRPCADGMLRGTEHCDECDVVCTSRAGRVALTIEHITRIAIEVAETNSFPVRVLASVSSGASSYVEILLRIENGDAPTLTQLGVFRDAGIDGLRRQLVERIRRR